MPRKIPRIPKYRLHKPTGLALVEVRGKRYYLGKHGTEDSQQAYARFVAEFLTSGQVPGWLANGRSRTATPEGTAVVTLCRRYYEWAASYYVDEDGSPTSTIFEVREALKPLKNLYGRTEAAAFGPRELKVVQQWLVDLGLCRSTVNRRIGRVRHVFKWGVAGGLVTAPTWQALLAVDGLRKGRSPAPDLEPVRPVPLHLLEATRKHMCRQVRDMTVLQELTGMRPGEVVQMRPCDLNTSKRVWEYRPARHKVKWRGQDRVVPVGPKAQAVIAPYLVGRVTDAPLFSPAEAEAERLAALHARRKTPLSCGNRPGTNCAKNPARPKGRQYQTTSYCRTVVTACDKAFPPPAELRRKKVKGKKGMRSETREEYERRLGKEGLAALEQWREAHRWSPNQLRHNAGTNLRREYGLEIARVVLGHTTVNTTLIYAEEDRQAALDVMAKVG